MIHFCVSVNNRGVGVEPHLEVMKWLFLVLCSGLTPSNVKTDNCDPVHREPCVLLEMESEWAACKASALLHTIFLV